MTLPEKGNPAMNRWNIMLIDHDQLFSAGLSALLDGSPFHITAAVPTVAHAVAALTHPPVTPPDIIIIASPLLDEGRGLSQVRRHSPARLVVLATGGGTEPLRLALQGGADACLDKSMSRETLVRALHLVALGEVVYPLRAAEMLATAPASPPAPASAPAPTGAPSGDGVGPLSPREVQILQCLLAGQSNKAIARQLSITESTVKMHFKNMMRKIQAQNRTQAAVWAIQNGLAPPAGPSP